MKSLTAELSNSHQQSVKCGHLIKKRVKTESNTNQFVAGAVVAVLARLGAIGRKLFG